MGRIKFLKTGLMTSIQDLGRIGYQKYGVPVAGVMDEYSHILANILVGNDYEESTIEITMIGPEIKFESDELIAITGANLNPKINDKPIEMWKTISITKGDVLSFNDINQGLRSYISFAGGLNIVETMGSKSYYSRANIGMKIQKGLELEINSNYEKTDIVKISDKYISEYKNVITCNVVLGPQDDYFKKEEIDRFFNSDYTITNESDRMGYRLKGSKIKHKKTADIISDGMGKGAIQIPGDGQPIIMMSDAQTTGGYTKIGYVIKKDLNQVAQLKPGDKIKFKKISIEEAQKRYKKYKRNFKHIKEELIKIKVNEYKLKIDGKEFNVLVEEI